ncbi:hypothetical protein PFICI_14647 [Pestalotiopsis fici W106-1]|uniref:Pectate lyase superfamily protein domain-containing protein n=1 Tax=Pestalotiopsis fici (strain W106-1 / CGMCC3.15140) TaxID=1229662 RepID=W3WLK4_PESFW|nr:uncharacterized protein PFICI_14647 [Pestalotiopsis fici W106-1]ETS73701.1 hypothetical protein PFICI_14647 [Pestalotiopsis fici W106-1]
MGRIMGVCSLILLVFQIQFLCVSAVWKYSNPERYPNVPQSGPKPGPSYMVDNTKNYYNVAPDKGIQNGPVWAYSGSHDEFVSNLDSGSIMRGGFENKTSPQSTNFDPVAIRKRQSGSYWLEELGPLGSQPRAGSGYAFYRNVLDFGADNTGDSDTVEAINAAVEDGNRCGEECGNTFSQGAIVYFPAGTYKICSPIIQLYYTQFIGDANDPPTILGCDDFKGIALIDTDPYIPGGNGANWYINQNQFFRQIRNFIFDLTEMPESTDDDDQPLVPTGIHWQVSQATSLQHLVFNMPEAKDDQNSTAVGIFTENGSGGFVSDLTFNGGNIGWRAGSQQYTAQNLKFNNCLTAIQMVWDWGWVWQRVEINGGAIGFNISGAGGITGQGIGSISVVDTSISNVPVGILTNNRATSPHIVLDNVEIDGVDRVVQIDDGDTLLTASGTIEMWTTGKVYRGDQGSDFTGTVEVPAKPSGLLSDGKLFVRTRPQYESLGASDFSVATNDGGCDNDGTGDQTECLNSFLREAVASTKIAYFPAGIYQVAGTVLIPTGSRVVGSSWSQIQGAGYYFSDMTDPKVVVQVGKRGDIGTMEITDMLFTVAGNTAGAIVLEWNVDAVSQGAAAMWDSHIRVGGAKGTDLDIEQCPKRDFNNLCIAASLMMHVTKQASGYFENVWVWAADHDNDMSVYDSPDKLSNQISVYCARGLLIESQNPSWFYGGGSEHSVMYNYLVYGAKDVYLGHIQTETPYYQPEPIAPKPFNVAASFPGDPDFTSCKGDAACASAWGMVVSESNSITVHGAGLYSFFQDYYQDCLETNDCQQRVLRVTGSTDVVFLNLFTVAISEMAVGIDKTVVSKDSNQRGFTTEISVWLPLDGADNINTVFVGTEIWTASTVTCSVESCLLIFPTSSLANPATISPSPFTTSFQYGDTSTVTRNGAVTVTFITTTTTTVLNIAPLTVEGIPYSNYNFSSGQSTLDITPSVDVPPFTISLPDGSGSTTTRVVPLPPWPLIDDGPTGPSTIPVPSGDLPSGSGTFYTGVTSTVTVSGATVTTITFPGALTPTTVACPPDDVIVFATPSTSIYVECFTATTFGISFNCPTTKVVSFLGPTTGLVSVDCSVVTGFPPTSTTEPPPSDSDTTTTPLPVWTTWPPGIIAPISTTVEKPEPTNGGTKQPCKLWFFFVCIKRDDLEIGGWFWSFPPGIYPPGPPPGIRWPSGFTLEGPLPPWPPITIGPGGELTYSEEPSECTTTQTASICSIGTTFSVTSGDTVTSTTATVTTKTCETISGCSVSQSTTQGTTTAIETCTVEAAGGTSRRRKVANGDHTLHKRACEPVPYVIYPENPRDKTKISEIRAALGTQIEGDNGREVKSDSFAGGYTAFFWVKGLSPEVKTAVESIVGRDNVVDYQEWNKNNKPPGNPRMMIVESNDQITPRGLDTLDLEARARNQSNDKYSPITSEDRSKINPQPWKRAATSATVVERWNGALVSLPKGQRWKAADAQPPGRGGVLQGQYVFFYDDSASPEMTVYVVGEPGGVDTRHEEWSDQATPPRPLNAFAYGNPIGEPTRLHGTQVAAFINGKTLGVCRKCKVAFTGYAPASEMTDDAQRTFDPDPRDWYLEDLLLAWEDMNSNGRSPATSVINMSWGSDSRFWYQPFINRLYDILKWMDRAGVTLVAASGNFGREGRKAVDTYPQLFANPTNAVDPLWKDRNDSDDVGYLPNFIVVGATNPYGIEAAFSQYADFLTTYAGGQNLKLPDISGYTTWHGTSFAAPQVAAVAGYYKGLPSDWQGQLNAADSSGPKAVKNMIRAFEREIIPPRLVSVGSGEKRALIWNGMDGDINCLLGGDSTSCPELPTDINDYTPPADCGQAAVFAELLPRIVKGNETMFAKRQSGGSCTLPADGGGGQITLTTGPAVGPTCANPDGCGGHICSGFWCAPAPTGYPPGYQDPKDPSSSEYTAPTTTIKPTTSSSSTTSSSTTSAAPAPTTSVSMCLGLFTNTNTGRLVNIWLFYAPGDAGNNRQALAGGPGEKTPLCDISRDNTSFSWCDQQGTFRDSGPQFSDEDSCGFQIELFGERFTPDRLDPNDNDNNPCNERDGTGSIRGWALWDDLPRCKVCLSDEC